MDYLFSIKCNTDKDFEPRQYLIFFFCDLDIDREIDIQDDRDDHDHEDYNSIIYYNSKCCTDFTCNIQHLLLWFVVNVKLRLSYL